MLEELTIKAIKEFKKMKLGNFRSLYLASWGNDWAEVVVEYCDDNGTNYKEVTIQVRK